MVCDYYANGDEDIDIEIRDYNTSKIIARFTIPASDVKKGMPLSVDISGMTGR